MADSRQVQGSLAILPPIETARKDLPEPGLAETDRTMRTLEIAMNHPAEVQPQGNFQDGGNAIRTLLVSVVGLLPVGVVSGMMLMQILGVWTY
jgi:hypothetical protein